MLLMPNEKSQKFLVKSYALNFLNFEKGVPINLSLNDKKDFD